MGKKISLTVDERVILHLMEYSLYEEDYEAPEGMTQAGIASGISVARKHIPRAVNKLMSEGLVASRVSHVKGSKQRKKVYHLTFEGKALSRRIWDALGKKEVIVRTEDGKDTPTTVTELCFTYQVGRSPVQILMDLRDGNVFYPHLASEPREEEVDEVVPAGDALKVYRKALTKAWEDDVLTRDELAILEELRGALRISDKDHSMLQEEILSSRDQMDQSTAPSRTRLLSEILDVALKDGVITPDEQSMIDELQRLLGIDKETYMRMLMERTISSEGMDLSDERKEEIFSDIYSSVLKETLKDGNISSDEQNILLLLKKLLSIEDEDHLRLLDKVRKYD
ncbi:MAG: hypothetical protein QCI82_06790 [Candidatus Thermoplasmatota archaeon]|nr:hypothetical protein [Candidatus Thermoplasmatota archaeon]